MYTSEELVGLINLGNGAAVEMFNTELEKVLNNLDDINKKSKDERSITLVVKFKPGETHGIISTSIEVKSKLSGQRVFATNIMMGRKGAKVEARELYQQQPLDFKNNVVQIEREKEGE